MSAMSTSPLLLVPDAMVAPAAWPPAEPLALTTKYPLDPFQQHAVLGIHAGSHVLITAKTGSGKTLPGEYLCAYMLARGKRVFYTTPIKSLSNQKYHDLKRLFPSASVGILTGDIKVCPDADIVVMTAEILRNLFYKRGTLTESVGLSAAVSLERVGGVVMDEVHFIQDPERGHVWEETLILCPPDLQLVMLSATLPSTIPLASWIANLHKRPTVLLTTTHRVVPLVHGLLERAEDAPSGYRVRAILDARGGWISEEGYGTWLASRRGLEDAVAAHRQAVSGRGSGHCGSGKGPWNRADHDRAREATAVALRASKATIAENLSPTARLQRTVDWLSITRQLPALFFVFSRRECERLATSIPDTLLDATEAAAATHVLDFHLSRYREFLEHSANYHTLRALLARGIAFHHSGVQPILKEIVEILFTRGYVKALFATETFAVGLNMPTKTVVFLELEKMTDGGQRRPLRTDEYLQMAGRAGRRGLDTQGLVLYEPLREPLDSATLRTMLTGALPPLQSQMQFGYDFVLRMRLSSERVDIATNSYWAIQQHAAREQLETDWRASQAAVDALSVDNEELLAAKADLERTIATSVNAKQKRARQALQAWMTANEDRWPKGGLAVAEKRYAALQAARSKMVDLATSVAEMRRQPLISTHAQERRLISWGFLTSENELTVLGRAATEVNEGHNILMPWLAESGLMKDVAADEIPCVLAAFMPDIDTDAELPSLSSNVNRVLDQVRIQARKFQQDEGQGAGQGVGQETNWQLSDVFPAVVARWQQGVSLSVLAAEFGIMEGTLQRSLMRVANLLEEWGAVATLRTDLPTLEKLASLTFLRGALVVDSLYLRL